MARPCRAAHFATTRCIDEGKKSKFYKNHINEEKKSKFYKTTYVMIQVTQNYKDFGNVAHNHVLSTMAYVKMVNGTVL